MAKNYGKNKTAVINLFNNFIKEKADGESIDLSVREMISLFNREKKEDLVALGVHPVSKNFIEKDYRKYLYIKRVAGTKSKWLYTEENKHKTKQTINKILENVPIDDIKKVDIYLIPHNMFEDGEYHPDEVFCAIREKLGIAPKHISYHNLKDGLIMLFISSSQSKSIDIVKDKLKA